MANFPNYPLKTFSSSQNFLARNPAGSGEVERVQGQSILDAAVAEILNRGDIVQAVDTLTEAIANDYASGIYVLTGGNAITLDGGQAIYRVSDPGSGGIVMTNGNELVLLFVANTPASIVTPLNSIADLPTATGSGNVVNVKSFYDGWAVVGDGLPKGGGVMIDSPELSIHNGGTRIDPGRVGEIGSAAYYTLQAPAQCWVRPNSNDVNVVDFGPKLDGSDDYAPVQAAINFAATQGWAKTNVEVGANFFGATKNLVFPTAVILIGSTLSIPQNYNQIDFNKCLFMPHASFNLANWAFDIAAYLAEYTGLRLASFTNGIKIGNPNLDTTVVRFNDLQASNISNLFEITLRSALFVVNGYRFDDVKIAAKVLDGDKIVFNDGWLSADPFDNNDEAHFILDSTTSPSLHLNGMFYVPTAQTATKCALVNLGSSSNNNPARVYINNILAGAEDGRVALVNSYAKGNVGRGTYINITDGSAFTASNPVVRLYDLPNAVSFTNQSGGIDETHTLSMIEYDPTIQTFAAAEAAVISGVYPEIWFNGYTPTFFENLPRATRSTLGKLIRSKNKTFRTYMQGVTTTPTPVVFNTTAVRFNRGKTWKIKATNLDNPGADRYTEVIVAGNAGGTTLSFVAIVQGTTVAPVFSEASGVLQVASTSATNDFAIEIEQLTDATEVFLT